VVVNITAHPKNDTPVKPVKPVQPDTPVKPVKSDTPVRSDYIVSKYSDSHGYSHDEVDGRGVGMKQTGNPIIVMILALLILLGTGLRRKQK